MLRQMNLKACVFRGISWFSWKTKQPTVALSMCKAEHVTLALAVQEVHLSVSNG